MSAWLVLQCRVLATAIPCVLALSACDDGAIEPIFEGEIMAVLAGRVSALDGAPVAGATLLISVPCAPDSSSCTISGGAVTDEMGHFVRPFNHDGRPYIAAAEVVAKPPIGQGYDLGMVVRVVEASFQPVPPADTTFVDFVLPPNQSDSRRPIWVQGVSFRALTRPLTADDENVYLSSPGGVAALDRETGEYLWVEGVSGGLVGLPYAVVGGVVVMARDDALSGLRSSTGELLWTRQGVPNDALTAAEPDQLFATSGDSIAAYDIRTGTTRWTRPLSRKGRVAIDAGEGVVCSTQQLLDAVHIECWNIADGNSLWSRILGLAPWLVVIGDRVVLPAGEGQKETGWIGLDPWTGRTIWKSNLPATGRPAVLKEMSLLYACTDEGAECLAVRMADGMTVWRSGFDEVMNPPAVGSGNLYVVPQVDTDPESLLVLDINTGQQRERIDPDPLDDRGFCNTPAVSGDMVFLFGCYGYLYAFRLGP